MFKNSTKGQGTYIIKCLDKAGNLKWEIEQPNLVVNEGLAYMNDTLFRGSGYTNSWYMGLISGTTPTIDATDTLASHVGWTEVPVTTGYSGNRKETTFSASTSADPSVATSAAVSFSMLGTYVISGALLCTVASGTSGTLFSASTFDAPGNRTVVSGDTLNITYVFELGAT